VSLYSVVSGVNMTIMCNGKGLARNRQRQLSALLKRIKHFKSIKTPSLCPTCTLLIVVAAIACMRTKRYCINGRLGKLLNDKGFRVQRAAV